MKKILLLTLYGFIMILINADLFAQQQDDEIKKLQDRLEMAEKNNAKLRTELKLIRTDLSKQITLLNDSIKDLSVKLSQNQYNIATVSKELGVKISATETNTNNKIQTLDNTVSKNTLYWIIAVLAIALLSILLFVLLRKQLTKDKTDITANIQQTKKVLEEEGVKLDSKLVDLLATQMLLMKEERQAVPSLKAEEVNHELALKVADEIIRIQKNLGNMDAETKGLKQLVASVKRIQDNFEANGYELIDMLNKPYDQGMKVSANFRPDETLKTGEQIITRIIKPQVNFKGVMIQAAQVEVSAGE
jgi:hypothetical protein